MKAVQSSWKVKDEFSNRYSPGRRPLEAESQLLYSSDYPHWDFDLPSTIYDLPFLKEKAKRDILGGNEVKLYKLDIGAGKLAKVA